ncbi:MAG: hypothetical protein ABIH25_05040 [Candidatus Woesearchaeota archaeon]
MNKRGDIWISAVLYMALGIVVLTIVLAAGLPVVNKMKDRQTLTQTKNVMNTLDQNIRTVYNEGPSSKRTVEVKIGRGEFKIIADTEEIQWSMDTKALLSTPCELGEVCTPINEGNLQILTQAKTVKGEYTVTITLDYSENIDLNYTSSQSIISGTNKISILNTGPNDDQTKTQILLEQVDI